MFGLSKMPKILHTGMQARSLKTPAGHGQAQISSDQSQIQVGVCRGIQGCNNSLIGQLVLSAFVKSKLIVEDTWVAKNIPDPCCHGYKCH
jgi:hypothetical protein